MTDLDPKIWKNKTLGSVGSGPFLQEVERQTREDRAARLAGREPRLFQLVDNYPKMPVSGSVPSFFEYVFKLVNRDPYDLKAEDESETPKKRVSKKEEVEAKAKTGEAKGSGSNK